MHNLSLGWFKWRGASNKENAGIYETNVESDIASVVHGNTDTHWSWSLHGLFI